MKKPKKFSASDKELTAYVKKLSMKKFGKPFKSWVAWNATMRYLGGKTYCGTDNHIELNPKISQMSGFRETVLHELCHYHLTKNKKTPQHNSKAFMSLLEKVGGTRYCQPWKADALNIKMTPRWDYYCPKCQRHFLYKQTRDKRYCRICKKRLTFCGRPDMFNIP